MTILRLDAMAWRERLQPGVHDGVPDREEMVAGQASACRASAMN
jgi:hypothetical protein